MNKKKLFASVAVALVLALMCASSAFATSFDGWSGLGWDDDTDFVSDSFGGSSFELSDDLGDESLPLALLSGFAALAAAGAIAVDRKRRRVS